MRDRTAHAKDVLKKCAPLFPVFDKSSQKESMI